jgi:hypothetical protein
MASLARGCPVCGNCRSHSSASAVSAPPGERPTWRPWRRVPGALQPAVTRCSWHGVDVGRARVLARMDSLYSRLPPVITRRSRSASALRQRAPHHKSNLRLMTDAGRDHKLHSRCSSAVRIGVRVHASLGRSGAARPASIGDLREFDCTAYRTFLSVATRRPEPLVSPLVGPETKSD